MGFTYGWANPIHYHLEHPAKQGWPLLWSPNRLGTGADMLAAGVARNIALACSQEKMDGSFSAELTSRG